MVFWKEAVITATFMFFVAIPATLRADTCDSLVCGDADGNGTYDLSDITYITNFLYAGGPAPALCGDIDGYDLITIRDIVRGAMMQAPICVNQPKMTSHPGPTAIQLRYAATVVPGASIHEFDLTLLYSASMVGQKPLKAYNLPLRIRVDGQVPQALSVSTVSSTFPGGIPNIQIDSAAGTILLYDLDGSTGLGYYTLCKITITVTPSQSYQFVEIEPAELGPTMTGIFEPPNSACNYVMFINEDLITWEPWFYWSCHCGDANGDTMISISDAVFIINFIFQGGPPPDPTCLGDSNATGSVNISDAIFLISHIFGGGPRPNCISLH